MEQIITLFPERIAYAISNTVLHSLWQITIIALAYFTLIKLRKNPGARFKYNSALIALFLSLGASIVCFMYFYFSSAVQFASSDIGTIQTVNFSAQLYESGTFSLENFLIQNQASIAALWLCGTLLLLIKFVSGILNVASLKYSAFETTDKRLSYLANTISAKLNIQKLVEIKESALITTPMVLGHLKPVILFPAAVSTQLSMNEIESILAHELAHIMRNDFLVNLLQSITEVLLYFHPCIWWLSSIVREERENCCDDIALHFVEDNLSYAKSLVKLQELQLQTIPRFALAFSGSKHQLKNRIMRILNQSNPSNFLREKLVAIALLFTFVLAFANNTNSDPIPLDEADCELEDVLSNEEFSNYSYSLVLEDDTIPEKNALIIKKKNKSESLDVKMEDGQIIELRIDGELIPEDRYDEYEDKITIDRRNGKGFTSPNFNFNPEDFLHDNTVIISNGETVNLDSILKESSKTIEEAMKHMGNFNFPQTFSYDGDSYLENFNYDNDTIYNDTIYAFPKGISEMMEKLGQKFEFDSPRIDSLMSGNMHSFRFDSSNGYPQWLENKRPYARTDNNLKSKMSRTLAEDDFLKIGKNKIELSGKHMKINGEKQPSNIWNKYKKVYEQYVGSDLNKDSKIVFEIDYDGKQKSKMRLI